MSKRSYPSDISQTSGAFRRAIERQRKRQRITIYRRSIGAGGGPAINVTRGRRFPRMGNQPMPQTLITTLRYTEPFSINPLVGSAAWHVFSANGLYDPNITGGGHQPMGFDQLMTFYNHYEVIGAKIKMSIVPSPEVTGFNFGIKLDDSSTLAASGFEVICEHAMTSFKTHPGAGFSNGFDVYSTYSAKKFFGDKAGDRETWGDASANPTDQAYFICFISPMTAMQDIASIPCMATIEYVVKFREAKDLNWS